MASSSSSLNININVVSGNATQGVKILTTNFNNFNNVIKDSSKTINDYSNNVKNSSKVINDNSNTVKNNTKNIHDNSTNIDRSTKVINNYRTVVQGASSSTSAFSQTLSSTTVALTAMTAGFGKLFQDVSSVATEFDKNMRNVNSIMRESESQFQYFSDQVREISKMKEVSDTATGVSKALYQVASSGFSGAEGLQLTAIASKAASAGMTQTEVSVRALTTLMNAYNQKTLPDAAKFSDELFTVVDRGVITFEQLANNLGSVLAQASSVGVKFPELGAGFIVMTKAGISAAESETALTNLLRSISGASPQAQAAAKKMGIELSDTALKTKGLGGVLEDLVRVTRGSASEMDKLIPEARAAKAALTLGKLGAKEFKEELERLAHATDNGGATQRALSEQMKSFSFSMNQVKAIIEDLKIEYGLLVMKGLTPLLDTGKEVLEFFRYLPDPVKKSMLAIGGFTLALGSLMLALKALVFTFGGLAGIFASGGALLAGLAKLKALYITLALFMSPGQILIVGLAAVAAAFYGIQKAIQAAGSAMDWFAQKSKDNKILELTNKKKTKSLSGASEYQARKGQNLSVSDLEGYKSDVQGLISSSSDAGAMARNRNLALEIQKRIDGQKALQKAEKDKNDAKAKANDAAVAADKKAEEAAAAKKEAEKQADKAREEANKKAEAEYKKLFDLEEEKLLRIEESLKSGKITEKQALQQSIQVYNNKKALYDKESKDARLFEDARREAGLNVIQTNIKIIEEKKKLVGDTKELDKAEKESYLALLRVKAEGAKDNYKLQLQLIEAERKNAIDLLDKEKNTVKGYNTDVARINLDANQKQEALNAERIANDKKLNDALISNAKQAADALANSQKKVIEADKEAKAEKEKLYDSLLKQLNDIGNSLLNSSDAFVGSLGAIVATGSSVFQTLTNSAKDLTKAMSGDMTGILGLVNTGITELVRSGNAIAMAFKNLGDAQKGGDTAMEDFVKYDENLASSVPFIGEGLAVINRRLYEMAGAVNSPEMTKNIDKFSSIIANATKEVTEVQKEYNKGAFDSIKKTLEGEKEANKKALELAEEEKKAKEKLIEESIKSREDLMKRAYDAEKQLAQDSFNFQKKLLDDYVKIQETKVSGIKTKIQELQDLIYGKKQSATQNKALSEQFSKATGQAGLSADLIASPALFDERMNQESLNISNLELSGASQDSLNKRKMEQAAKVFVYNSTKAKELANDINRQKDAQDLQKKAQDAQKQYYELAKIQTDDQIQSQINIEANALSTEQKVLDEKIRTANEYENYFNNTVMVEIDNRYKLSADAWLSYMKTANISWSKDLESKMGVTLSQFKNVVSLQSSGIKTGSPVSGLKEGESYDAWINRIKLEDAKAEQARQNKMSGKTGANFGNAFANVPRFASGGVTEGGLNYLHPKEMILNQSQQANLFQMLNSPRPNMAGNATIMVSVSGNNINSQMDVNNIASQISNSIAKEYRKISSGY
jgi:TP901 family phage tail tape measure protein